MGHGTLLAGRYRLEERVRTGTDGSLWRAVDETLDRPVSVRVVRPGHRNTADVMDAARRAALVEDARLVRVLDVGESGGSAYIVSEHLVGRTLEELLVAGPIPAESVRRLVGEAAQALDRASARGLHHLRLSPASLVVSPDGAVKVLGTAVEAALAGVEQQEDPLGADRVDAVGLVRVLYAGLTGRWPGIVDGPLGPAPRVTGRAVPPGDLVADVPNDLDTLCAVTLGPHDDGPNSPGELARQLGPWGRGESPADAPGPASRPTRPAPPAAGAVAGRRPGPPAETPVETPAGTVADLRDVEPVDLRDVREPAPEPVSGARAVRHATPARGMPSGGRSGPDPAMPTLLPRDLAGGGGAGRGPVNGSSRSPVPGDRGGSTARSGPGSSPGAASGGRPPQRSETGGPTTGGRSVSHADGTDDWELLQRSAPVPARPPQPGPAFEPLGPFIPSAPVNRPPRDQTRFVLIVVGVVAVLVLGLAAFSLRGLLSVTDPIVQQGPLIPSATPTPTPAASSAASPTGPSASASTPATSSPSGSPSPSLSGTPASVSGVQAIDPQGDGSENGSTADRAIDGDPSTNWRSARYNSATFGGLKQGLGMFLQLTGDTVQSVTVSMSGTGGTVELRTAEGPGLDGSAVVATAQIAGGSAVLTPTQPLPAGPLLLWFTELPRQDNGEYRLVVTEITVS